MIAAGGISELDAVTAEVNYSIDTGVKPVNESYGPGLVWSRNVGELDPRQVRIHSARSLAGQLALERNGFALVEHPTRVADFFDRSQITARYYPEVAELVARVSGAQQVIVFDHTVRSGAELAEREARQLQEPVLLVHNDYTAWSGPQRLRDILPDQADARLRRRFAIIQVWRPIERPAERNPLAIVDARSLAPGDLIASERRYPDRIGEIYRVAHNPDHAWFYVPRMRPDEALVFTVYDSETDGRPRFSAHTAFSDPTTPPDAAPRQSIEARAFAFFDPLSDR